MPQQGQKGGFATIGKYITYATFAFRNVSGIKSHIRAKKQEKLQTATEQITADLTEAYIDTGATDISNVSGALNTAASLIAKGDERGEKLAENILGRAEQQQALLSRQP